MLKTNTYTGILPNILYSLKFQLIKLQLSEYEDMTIRISEIDRI